MVVGIDASRAFDAEKTGTETYSYEVVSRMLVLPEARKHEWIVYTRDLACGIDHLSLGKMPNVKFVNIGLKYLWTQVGLAYRTWVDKLDVLWVPAHTLSLLRRGFGGLGRPLKTVVTIHGIEYEWLPAYKNVLQRWYLPLSTKYAVKSATKLIAVSQFTADQIVDRLGGVAEKIKVIHEGVVVKVLNSNFKDPNKRQILKKYKLEPKKYLLFVGTVQPRKNLKRLIEAFANFFGEGNYRDELKLVIVGKMGWGYEEVVVAVKKYGVEGKVVFAGYVSDEEKWVLLSDALCYIQPSITEGFGLPILEAMAAGVPVLTSNGGALPEVINSKDTKHVAGLMFDPLDVCDLVKKMQLIIGDRKLRERLVKEGRARVKELNWERTAKETLKLLTTYSKKGLF